MSVRARWLLLALVTVLVSAAVVVTLVVVDARSRRVPAPVPTGSTGPTLPTGAPVDGATYYGTRTPYPVPTSLDSSGPAGYAPVFAQHLGRHGARTATPASDGEDASALWRRASRAGALTPLGEQLGPELEALDAATDRLGLGRLTTDGRREQEGLGRRTGTRLAGLWASAGESDEIDVVTSGRTRTQQSAQSFVGGLTAEEPGLRVEPPRTDRRLLSFDSTDADYRAFIADDPGWRRASAAATRGTDLEAAARDVLERLYAPSFVAALDDPQAEAESLYERYRGAPSLAADLRTPVDLRPFFPSVDAAAFAFAEDARYFYSRGPGVTGDDRSHRAAQVLVDDFWPRPGVGWPVVGRSRCYSSRTSRRWRRSPPCSSCRAAASWARATSSTAGPTATSGRRPWSRSRPRSTGRSGATVPGRCSSRCSRTRCRRRSAAAAGRSRPTPATTASPSCAAAWRRAEARAAPVVRSALTTLVG